MNYRNFQKNAALLSAAVFAAAAPAIALDLKGVELGKVATSEQLQKQLGCEDRKFMCQGSTMLEGVSVATAVSFGPNHTVDSILVKFHPLEFPPLMTAAKAKWGKPNSSERVPMENGFGAQVTSRVLTWTQADGSTVMLFEYAEMGSGALLLSLPKAKPDAGDSRM